MRKNSGQKRLQAELKPAAERAQKKKKVDLEKETKKKPEAKVKAKFLVKKHKRKANSGETIMVCAIHDNSTGKQVAQLSSNATPDCSMVVAQLVSEMNEGKKSLDTVQAELLVLKKGPAASEGWCNVFAS